MSFPKRFKELLEPDPQTIPRPDYVWLVWAACGGDESACGWSGWIVEAAFKRTGKHHPTSTGDALLAASDNDRCPECGRSLFRSDVDLRLEPSADQRRPGGIPRVDYDVSPMEYE